MVIWWYSKKRRAVYGGRTVYGDSIEYMNGAMVTDIEYIEYMRGRRLCEVLRKRALERGRPRGRYKKKLEWQSCRTAKLQSGRYLLELQIA